MCKGTFRSLPTGKYILLINRSRQTSALEPEPSPICLPARLFADKIRILTPSKWLKFVAIATMIESDYRVTH
jgi:hypothetical protein